MQQSNIAKAIIAVMKAVKGIDKNLTVGTGNSSYKGVSDQDVKKIVGAAMSENGLCILPIGVEASTKVERWEETGQYGNKQKQSVFTEAKTKYLLLHESGESIEIEGYGHGVDSQDKSAGKATTYALKYALLYAFMVPTGKIDDADAHDSNESTAPPSAPPQEKPWLNENTEEFSKTLTALKAGKIDIAYVKNSRRLSKETEEKLVKELKAA